MGCSWLQRPRLPKAGPLTTTLLRTCVKRLKHVKTLQHASTVWLQALHATSFVGLIGVSQDPHEGPSFGHDLQVIHVDSSPHCSHHPGMTYAQGTEVHRNSRRMGFCEINSFTTDVWARRLETVATLTSRIRITPGSRLPLGCL